jgi:hypothetical protein
MQIRTSAWAVALALSANMMAAASACAQEESPRTSVGWAVSVFHFSPFVEAAGEQVVDARFDTSLGGLLFVHHWLNPWVGLQVDGAYTRPQLVVPDQSAAVETWSFSGGATVRPLGPPRPLAPYGMASIGMISYGLGGPPLRLGDDGLILDSGRTEQLLFQVGGGVDVRALTLLDDHAVGLRVEGARLMVTGRPFRVEGEADQGGQAHWRLSVGLHTSLPRN